MFVSTPDPPLYLCFLFSRHIMDSQGAIRKFSPGSGFSPPVAGVTAVPNRFPRLSVVLCRAPQASSILGNAPAGGKD